MPDRDRPRVAAAEVPPSSADRLERRLARERAVRLEAEEISELATRRLYDQQQRLTVLTTVANASNEARAIEPAIEIALEATRDYCGWALGHAWLVQADGSLAPTNIWSGAIERFDALRVATRGLRLEAGEGVPGRVLSRGEAVWVQDFPAEEVPRSAIAAELGLPTAMAFPIWAGSEVVGVLEFFSDRVLETDPNLLELFAQVGTELGRVAERRIAAERLLHQATHDALTDLPNRRLIGQELGEVLAGLSSQPEVRPAVFFIDLDGFKEVNDTLGHAAGDCVLRDVAERLELVIQPGDTLGRLSGDEFVILCRRSPGSSSAAVIGDQILAVLRQPFAYGGELFQVTASVGITDVIAGKGPEELIAEADAAMYHAKELGRGRYEVYSEDLGESLRRRTEMERALRHAVERDELELHYQPEIDLRTGAIVGVEALLRWHRDGTMLMPGDFIPVAEETGLIVPIGAWVLDAAVEQVQKWHHDASIEHAPWMSVNLSVRQLADPNLITRAREALIAHDADPANLVLEVTESVILDNVDFGLTVLTELNRLGTEIAIDDFGTGYASLSYLARFPAHTLKVDRSFIGRLDDPRTRAIVTAMIELAHALGLTAVAEGIETPEQLAILGELGCDLGQGFYFARPMPVDRISELIRADKPFVQIHP